MVAPAERRAPYYTYYTYYTYYSVPTVSTWWHQLRDALSLPLASEVSDSNGCSTWVRWGRTISNAKGGAVSSVVHWID